MKQELDTLTLDIPKDLPKYDEMDFTRGLAIECSVCKNLNLRIIATEATVAFNCPNDSWKGLIFSLPSMMPTDLPPRKKIEEEYSTPVSLQFIEAIDYE